MRLGWACRFNSSISDGSAALFRYNARDRSSLVAETNWREFFEQRMAEIREGFGPAFWAANFTEIFERVAYYATMAVLAIYLYEVLHFSSELTGRIFRRFLRLAVYLLPILGGTLADSLRLPALAYVRFSGDDSRLFSSRFDRSFLDAAPAPFSWRYAAHFYCILLIPALGPALVKPCVAGTIARDSTENVRSLGYSILHYTIVNVGGAIGPALAWFVRKKFDLGFRECIPCCRRVRVRDVLGDIIFLPRSAIFGRREGGVRRNGFQEYVHCAGKYSFRDVSALISSGFYVIFWQEFISLPIFIRTSREPQCGCGLCCSPSSLLLVG